METKRCWLKGKPFLGYRSIISREVPLSMVKIEWHCNCILDTGTIVGFMTSSPKVLVWFYFLQWIHHVGYNSSAITNFNKTWEIETHSLNSYANKFKSNWALISYVLEYMYICMKYLSRT